MKNIVVGFMIIFICMSLYSENSLDYSFENREEAPPTNLTATVVNNDVVLNWLAPEVIPPEGITEGFEETFPPTYWTTIVNNTTHSWAQYETVSFNTEDIIPTEGTYQAGVMWTYGAQDEWLITPAISEVNALTFDFYGHYGSPNGDNYYVKISTDEGLNWTSLWNASSLPSGDNQYDTPIEIDLSAYANNSIQIAWNFVDGDGQGLWFASYIDNVIFTNNEEAVAFDTSELKSFSKAQKQVSSNRRVENRFSKDPDYVLSRSTRNLTAYKIYRDNEELAEVDADALTYNDLDLDDGSYEYYVTAIYGTEESTESNSVLATIETTPNPDDYVFEDSFETYTDFALEADPWTFTDVDNNETYGFINVDFPNSESEMAYIVFNPTQTTPPYEEADAHTGDKYLACFASISSSNNDWLISPLLEVSNYAEVSFWAKSVTNMYGMERFKVHVSTGSTSINSFSQISSGTYTQVGDQWTQFSYNLDNYAGQNIRIAIQCVSNDAFIFMVDDFKFTTSSETPISITLTGQLVSLYNDNMGIEGEVFIEGIIDFEAFTDAEGNFTVLDMPLNQSFTLTANAIGHEPYTIDFETTTANLDLGAIELSESLDPPELVTANLIYDYVYISWFEPGFLRKNNNLEAKNIRISSTNVSNNNTLLDTKSTTKNNRALLGYNIYRFLESSPETWNQLNDEIIAENDYIDLVGSVLEGNYQYAVEALYSGDRISEPAFSDIITIIHDVTNPPSNLTATVEDVDVILNWLAPERLVSRDLTAYKVYRDDEEISEVSADVLTWTDNVSSSGVYIYHVTAMYGNSESESSNSVEVWVYVGTENLLIEDSFETYADFDLEPYPWTLIDGDLSPTSGITDVSFENSGMPMAYIVFNPTMTTPPLTGLEYEAVDGNKYMACFASTISPNNDWLISQAIELGGGNTFRFWAKSLTAEYGLERFNVLVSLGYTNPNDFMLISDTTYIEASTDWTQYSFNLDEFGSQTVRVAIQCVSDDAFILMVDHVKVESQWGDNDDPTVPQLTTALLSNYPNPFNPETTISYSVEKEGKVTLEVYNILGQKVKTLVNDNRSAGIHNVVWNGKDETGRNVASGIYFYQMKNGIYSKTHKMILMK